MLTAVVVALLGAPSSVAMGEDANDDEQGPGSVLFVGNSFTFFNGGVEKQVAALAAAESPAREIVVTPSTVPGATLKRQYQLSEPESSSGALDDIRAADHDVVVLQGDIPENYEHDVALFLEYARLFDEEIRAVGSETVFFMTWPYERLDWIDLDGIVEAHRQIEAETGAKVAPVGVAMDMSLAERPDLAMLGSDAEHESEAGTYLAAATIYATLFDASPEGLDFVANGVTPDDAAYLQRIAWEAVQEWNGGEPAD
jgi:hypothetical protein